MAGRGGVGAQAFLRTQMLGIPLTAPLVDGTRLGSFWVRVGVAIGTGNTNVAHDLGRIPSIYIPVMNSSGGVVYNGSAGTVGWTGTLIILRATVAGTYSLLIG